MWATLPIPLPNPIARRKARRGFTIVELLIVIVVIGILAGIIIVAYNGIQQRAVVASLQSDLDGAAKQLAIDQVTNGTFPATPAAANGGQGLKVSPNNSFSYTVNNSANPQTFCIASTNGSTIYSVTSTNNTPTTGGCVITNLMPNPNFGSGLTGGYGYNGSNGTGSISLSTDRAHVGTQSLKVVASNTAANNGLYMGADSSVAGTYTFSAWVYIPSTGGFTTLIPAVGSSVFTPGQLITARDQWVRVSIVAPVSTSGVAWYFYDYGGVGSEATGNVFYVNQTMQTQGSNLYNYADGSSLNWTWNGTANASTSTGRQL
jgi:prepilin-type N-terminal cleavage/methylation domain-containing protein